MGDMSNAKGERLSASATSALLARMKATPAPAARPKAPVDSKRVGKPLSQADSLERLRKEREIGRMLGVTDPYYRMHDVRAGAESVVGGRRLINFASYDYLGLNGHPEILAAVTAAAAEWGTSVSASRLTAGERSFHLALEKKLAELHSAEDAAVFVGGHATNVSVIGDLMGPKDWILHDALIHNSCVIGAKLSGAARRTFPHNDLAALEAILESDRGRYDNVLIVTEGIFSMDGDGPDLAGLIALKEKYGCWLMVDEAHSIGVLGATGRGIAEHQGVDPAGVDIWMGTLSKTTVSCGGYVAGSAALIDFAKYIASGQVYSVGMPATAAAAAIAAIDLMHREPERIARLAANGDLFLRLAKAKGLNTGDAWGYGVVPIIVGDSLKTVKLAERLFERGINAFPVLPPGVPEKTARLRFFISSEHRADQIRLTIDAVAEELARLAVEEVSVGSALTTLLKATATEGRASLI